MLQFLSLCQGSETVTSVGARSACHLILSRGPQVKNGSYVLKYVC